MTGSDLLSKSCNVQVHHFPIRINVEEVSMSHSLKQSSSHGRRKQSTLAQIIEIKGKLYSVADLKWAHFKSAAE